MNLQRCARLLVALAATALFAACQREVSPPDLAGVVEPLEAGTERFVLDGGARDRASMQDDRGADAVACGDPAKGDLVIPYPGTGSGIASTSFTLTVNCKPVFVEEFSGISYAHFAFGGTAHLSLLTTANAASYTLSPTSSGIHPVVNGAVTTFDLTVPRKLLFWARTTGANLIILADPPEDESYSSSDPGVTDIASYGVVADGTEVVTTTLQSALDDVAAVPGGGVLYFGPGIYSTGSLRVGSFTTVYLAPGATLRGTGKLADYPADLFITHGVSGTQSAGPEFSQLEFRGAASSRLIGRGTVDMNGTLLRGAGSIGGRLLQIVNSTDIEVNDVILRDPASWNTQILSSSQVTLTNVKVINGNTITNTDGIDPDSSQGVLVDDAFVYAGDDGFAIKSTGCFRGLVSNPSDIVIRNSTVFSLETALKIGTESLAEITEGVTFENDDVITAERAIGLYVKDGSLDQGNAWRAIRVETIVIPGAFVVPYPYDQTASSQLLELEVVLRTPTSRIGSIEGVTIEDLEVQETGQNPSSMTGQDSTHEVSGVAFTDTTVAGSAIASVADLEASLNAFVSPPTFALQPNGFGEPTVYITAPTLYATHEAPGVFTIGRTGSVAADLEIDFTIHGTAVNGVDYAAMPSFVVLPAGTASTTVSVAPLRASAPDPEIGTGLPPPKTVRLSLVSSPTQQYLLGPSYQAVVTFSP
jgi:hypothetical protein